MRRPVLDRSQIRDLLGSGLSNELVASAVGCTPSYISQLMSEQDFADEVIALRAAFLQGNTRRDRGIDKIEEGLIERLEELMPALYKPNDVLRAFAVLNAAKRRGMAGQTAVSASQPIVQLQIPVVVVQKFVVSKDSEVIEVSGQTLVTKPSHQLLKELVSAGGDDADEYKKALSHLPTGNEQGSSDGAAGYTSSEQRTISNQTNPLQRRNNFNPGAGDGIHQRRGEGSGGAA